ncbi:hypothetical protein [Roseofilum casamattae]|uniref:Uncharacterized protein n=1 Tax=Roseofilum casamattae BLCC-M143 TaxID=3022442 RepID=A0ABT7C1W9_9CYAN|nr:hypothetical protein [Roseofilum casamattae]MDJ1184523.1 hypothetical protein [Roseofilum casamattae BLCC-M143]
MSLTLEDNRQRAILLIQEIEEKNVRLSPYAIANELRRYTRISYTNSLFRWATLSDVDHIDNRLDLNLTLCAQTVDFAHLIAALSDQIDLPGWKNWWNFTTDWTGKHSSWSGDLAQAVLDFRDRKFTSMEDALNADASLPDLAANVAAVRVGSMVNRNTSARVLGLGKSRYDLKISEGIITYNRGIYAGQVREFIIEELQGQISQNKLVNVEEVTATIRSAIVEFLGFMRLLKFGIKLKNWQADRTYRQLARVSHQTITVAEEVEKDDVRSATAYFLNYLFEFGQLLE